MTNKGVLYPIKMPNMIFSRQREAYVVPRDPGERYNSILKDPNPKLNTAEMIDHIHKYRAEEADLLEKSK